MEKKETINLRASGLGVVSEIVWLTVLSIIFAVPSILSLLHAGNPECSDATFFYFIGSALGVISLVILFIIFFVESYEAKAFYEVDPENGRIIITEFYFPHGKIRKVIKYDRVLKIDGGRRGFLNAGNVVINYVRFLNTEPETGEVEFKFLTDPVSAINQLSRLIEKSPAMELTVKE